MSANLATFWADTMFRTCWQGAVLILLVAALCRFIRLLPAGIKCALWWLACGKLALGILWYSPPAVPILPVQPRPSEIAAISSEERADLTETAVGRIGQIGRTRQIERGTALEPRSQPATHFPSLPFLAAVIWLAGTAFVLCVRMRQASQVYRKLRATAPVRDHRALQAARDAAVLMGLKSSPPILESDDISMPLVAGLRRPALYLPLGFVDSISADELRMAIAHELSHIRRHDLWWSIVPASTQALFWFFPPAWWAAREFSLWSEAACDAEAVAAVQAEPATYGRMLIRFVHNSGPMWSVAALGSSLSYRSLERRLLMLQIGSSSRRSTRAAAFYCVGAALILALPWRLTAQHATQADAPAKPAPVAKPAPPKKAPKPASRVTKPKPATLAEPAVAPAPKAVPKSANSTPALAVEPISADTVPLEPAIAVPTPKSADTVAVEPALSKPTEPISTDSVALAPAIASQDIAKSPAVALTPVDSPKQATTAVSSVPPKSVQSRATSIAPVTAVPVQVTAPSAAAAQSVSLPRETVTAVTRIQQNVPIAVQVSPTIAGRRSVVATVRKPMSVTASARNLTPAQSVEIGLGSDKVINLDLEQVSCLQALKKVFKHFGVDYRIDQDAAAIAGETNVTLHLTKAPLRNALQMILESTRAKGDPLTYRVENGVTIIVPSRAIRPADASGAYERAVEDVFRTRRSTPARR